MPLALDLGQLALGEIGQFEIVEEQVEELVAGEHEAERVLAVAVAAPPRPAAAAAGGRGSMSPSTNFLLPGSTMSRVPPSAAEARLAHAVERDR